MKCVKQKAKKKKLFLSFLISVFVSLSLQETSYHDCYGNNFL